VHALANALVDANPGRQPIEELPTLERFAKACNPLPEEAQLCLNALFLRSHKEQCDAAFQQAERRDWLLLERLFLLPEVAPSAVHPKAGDGM
jgi:hypothetical protein